MTGTTRSLAVLTVLLAALSLAGCSGDEEPEPIETDEQPSTETPPSPRPAAPIEQGSYDPRSGDTPRVSTPPARDLPK